MNVQNVKAKFKNGKEMYLFDDTSWFSKRIISSNGSYQKRNFDFVKKMKKRYKTILDIGAHVGMNTIQYSEIADKIYSFEASPQTFSLLEKNMELYELNDKVKIFNHPLGSIDDYQVLFKINFGEEGTNKVITKLGKKTNKSLVVELLTKKVDTLVEQNNIKDIEFIKMDVEGYEYEVLSGMLNTLKDNNYPILQLELVDAYLKRNSSSCQKVHDLLYNLGYKAYNYKGEELNQTYEKIKGISDSFFIHNTSKIHLWSWEIN